MKIIAEQHGLKLRQASKITLASLICVCSNFIFNLPHTFSFMSVVTVYVIFGIYYADVYSKSIQRLIGTVAFSSVSFLIIYCLNAHPLVYYAVALGMVFITGSLIQLRAGYSFLIGSIYAAVIFVYATMGEHTIHADITILWEINLEIIMGIISCALLEKLLPYYSPTYLSRSLTVICKEYILYITRFMTAKSFFRLAIKHDDFFQLEARLKKDKYKHHHHKKQTRQLLSVLENLFNQLRLLNRCIYELKQSDLYTLYQIEIEKLISTLKQQIKILPKQLAPCPSFITAVYQFKTRFQADRTQRKFKDFDYQAVLQLVSISHIMNSVVLSLKTTNSQKFIPGFTPTQLGTRKSWLFTPSMGCRFVFILLSIFLVQEFFAWENAMQIIIAAMVMSIQPNFGSSLSKMKQRLIGVILGGIVCLIIISLLKLYTHYIFAIILLAISFFIFAYIAVFSKRLLYIGVQAGLIIAITLLGSGILTGDMGFALGRLYAVFQGTALGVVSILLFSPKFPKRLYSIHSDKLFQLSAQFMQNLSENTDQEALLFTMSQELHKAQTVAADLAHVSTARQMRKAKILAYNELFLRVILYFQMLDQATNTLNYQQKLKPYLAEVITGLTQAFQERTSDLTSLGELLQQKLRQFRSDQITQHLDLPAVENISLILSLFINIHSALASS